jgi:hypothetical protein
MEVPTVIVAAWISPPPPGAVITSAVRAVVKSVAIIVTALIPMMVSVITVRTAAFPEIPIFISMPFPLGIDNSAAAEQERSPDHKPTKSAFQ